MADKIDVRYTRPNQFAPYFLDFSTANVIFFFEEKDAPNPVELPAHKIILSSCSPVFKTMFFGSLPEKTFIRMVDATAAGFKEFLQYFYLDKIKLTVENAAEVIYLCKKYEVDELMNICSTFLQQKMPIDLMCTGLQLAMKFDMTELRNFCANQIVRNPAKFFESKEFLGCSIDVLKMILKLDDLKFYSQDRLRGCLRWARHALMLQHANERPKLEDARMLLNDCFDLIEFDSMEGDVIIWILAKYNKFFTTNDLDMIHKILAAKFPLNLIHTGITACNLRKVVKPPRGTHKILYINETEVITFQSSRHMHLVGLGRQKAYYHIGINHEVPVLLTVTKKSPNDDNREDIVLLRQNHSYVVRSYGSKPHENPESVMITGGAIAIEPNTEYEIQLKFLDFMEKKYSVTTHFSSNVCDLGNNEKVVIHGCSIISKLNFKF